MNNLKIPNLLAGIVTLPNQASTPSTPPAGQSKFYVDNAGDLQILDSSGVPAPIGGGGGASTDLSNISAVDLSDNLTTTKASALTLSHQAATYGIQIDTTNNGAGASGNINIQTGTATTTRGNIIMNANQIEMGVPFGGTVFINSSQVTLRAATSAALRLGTSSIPVGIIHARSTGADVISSPIRVYSRVTAANLLLTLHTDVTSPTGLTRGANITNPFQETDGTGQGNLILSTRLNPATSAAQAGGGIFLETGDRTCVNAGAVSGAIRLQTGISTNNNGPSGPIILQTGLGLSRGDINLTGNRVDASASVGPLRVPNLAADPGTPLNGDIWYNTTTFQLKARVNDVTVVLA